MEIEERVRVLEIEVGKIKTEQSTIISDIKEIKDTDLKEIKEMLRDRLPIWATALISTLTSAIGFLIAYIALA